MTRQHEDRRSTQHAALLLLLLCAAAPPPAAAAVARRMMLQDVNATTTPALLEDATPSNNNASSPAPSPAEPQLGDATPSSNSTASPAPSPEPQQLDHPQPLGAGPASYIRLDDKIKYLVATYCQQQTGWDCAYAVASTGTSQVAFVDDGFTPVELSDVRVADATFAAFACAYSETARRCQLDLSQEVEGKVSSTTTDGFSLDVRVG
jgi:hypothetical protein